MHSRSGQHPLPPALPPLSRSRVELRGWESGTFLVWRPAPPLRWFAEQLDTGVKDACVEEAAVERRRARSYSDGLRPTPFTEPGRSASIDTRGLPTSHGNDLNSSWEQRELSHLGRESRAAPRVWATLRSPLSVNLRLCSCSSRRPALWARV